MVDPGLEIACRFAIWPTRRSPPSVNATIDGVVREPSLFGMTTASPPSMTETQLLVVPRSMPITFPIARLASRRGRSGGPLGGGLHGDAHHRRADEPVVQPEAPRVLHHHGAGRLLAS